MCCSPTRGSTRSCALSTVAFSEPPWRMDEGRAEFMFTLSPGERIDLFVEAGAGQGEPPSRERFRRAAGRRAPHHPPARAARRTAAQFRRRPQRLVRAVARRPWPAGLRPAHRTLSVRRHPLVLDPVRPRRPDHRLAGAVAGPVAGQGRADLPRRAPGHRDLRLPGQPARQDHARDPRRRDGGAGGDPVRALLRRRRHHAAVRRAWPAPICAAPTTSR